MNIKTQIITAALLSFGITTSASAITIGMFDTGPTGRADSNMDIVTSGGLVTPGDGADTWVSLNVSTFNSMSTAALLSSYDTLVLPWRVSNTLNADWNSVLLPYLNGGGNILWEDPSNIGDISGASSGLTLTSGSIYGAVGENDISLVAPFGDDDASGYYHIHYSIVEASSDWSVWSTDINGRTHGVYREFDNGGRMVLGVSDNLYHPDFSDAGQADHYALTVNELNWLNTGSVTGIPTPVDVPEPASLALLALGLAGLGFSRKKRVV